MYAEKLPPHDLQAEEAVLGSILIDGEALLRVLTFLQAEDFFSQKHRWCYEAFLALFQRGDAINEVTAARELEHMGRLADVGGPAFLSHLVATVPTPLHAEHYARIVTRCATMQRLIRAAGEIASIGYEGPPDVDDALRRAEDALFQVRSRQPGRDFVSLREVLDQYLEEKAAVLQPLERGGAPVATGFDALDELLGGLQRSDLIILASRPGVGKSTLALNVALSAARHGQVVGIFSLEMSREQLALRFLSSEAGVDSHRLRLGLYTEAEEARIYDAVGTLSELPIYMDDTPLASLAEIRAKSLRLSRERGLDLLVVDYLQLVRGSVRSENRVQEVSEISRELKGLARRLNVPLIAASQLSRAVEARPSHRPQLSDLRESGSIEQDADVVMFIFREDMMYTQEEWEARFPDRPYPKNVAELIVAKHRHGPVGTVNLLFRNTLSRFENLSTAAPGPY